MEDLVTQKVASPPVLWFRTELANYFLQQHWTISPMTGGRHQEVRLIIEKFSDDSAGAELSTT